MPLLRLWDGKHIHCLLRRKLRRSHQRPNGRKALRFPSFYRILHAIANKILQKFFSPKIPASLENTRVSVKSGRLTPVIYYSMLFSEICYSMISAVGFYIGGTANPAILASPAVRGRGHASA
mgnify:FL=1